MFYPWSTVRDGLRTPSRLFAAYVLVSLRAQPGASTTARGVSRAAVPLSRLSEVAVGVPRLSIYLG